MSEGAKLLGIVGKPAWRKLYRRLRAAERKTGRAIIIETVGENGGPQYMVTRASLLRFCHQLFIGMDELTSTMARDHREHVKELVELKERIEDLEARLGFASEAIRRAR